VPTPVPEAPPPAPAPSAPIANEKAPEKGVEIEVAAGSLRVGSPTGSRDRDPTQEADDIALSLGAFRIDALPYPNDPAQAPRTDTNRKQAADLCAAEGKRLCSELEWERACKGDENAMYPAPTNDFDPARCKADLKACRSPWGVFALGVYGREWTSSDVTFGLGDTLRTAVVRGASASPTTTARQYRCASRDAATPDSKGSSLTFRCCRGPVNDAKYPVEPERPQFEEQKLSKEALTKILTSVPAMRDVAETFRLFSAREIDQGLEDAHTSRMRMAPWIAAPSALAWSPVHGEQVLVLTGDTPKGALLIALYPLRDGSYTLIGSLESAQEHLPFVVGYKPDAPKELLFSTCWGCGGEGGAISAGEDARIAIQPR